MADAFTLTLLHFNIQYCAGGLDGLFAGDFDASDAALQDQIVVESLAPVLDVLDAHPTWTFDLEMQGYMVEVMAERHPDVLDHLRTLAKAGQVELVSFHWSDQLFTAFPAIDMEASSALTRKVFADNDLPLSDVVFTQEGQFSEGMLDRMPEWGWHVAVMPSNLAYYLWGGVGSGVYRHGDTTVIPAIGVPGQAGWSFLNDGELWATNGLNCYLGPGFVYDAEATQRRVDELEAAEAAGSRIVGIGTYAASLDTASAPELPPVLDGTWQPDDTDDLGLWMGRSGLWGEGESDNGVRTTNMRARAAVLAAASIPGADPDVLEQAWKELLLGEVSDATGWNPYPTEVVYGVEHSEHAQVLASEAIADPCADAGATRAVVTNAGGEATVAWDGEVPEAGTGDWGDPPADVTPTTTGRDATLTWTAEAAGWRLDVTFAPGEDPPAIVFPWDAASYSTVPALGDALVDVDAADVYSDGIGLPLSWGLAHLTGDWYVVKHMDTVHLAGNFDRAGGTLTFRDQTVPADESVTWTFELLGDGMADPVEYARSLNVTPTVSIVCPATKPSDALDGGCGCAAGPDASGFTALGVGLAALLRRRGRAGDVRA